MFFCLLSFSLGAIVLHCTSWLPLLPETFIKVLVFCCFGAAVIFQCLSYFQSSAQFSSHFSSIAGFSQGSKRALLRLLAVALLFGVGFFYAYLELIQHKQMIVKEPLVDNVLVKSARACSLVREREHYNQVDMCFKLDGAHEELGRYRLSYGKGAFKPHQHACWSLKLVLKPPRSTYNPWVSNYERHLFYQRVLGLGRILSASPVECYELRSLDDYVLAMRQLAQSHLQGVYELLQHPGLVEALILGEKSKITAEENRVLAGSGTQHLMAISGLHVGLVCWFFFSSLTLLSMHRFRLVGVAVVGLVYILFVGFSPSAQRAWVMVLCALVMVLGYVPKRPWVGFITALAVVLVLDPIAPLSLGFWFSFSAVGALILMAQLNIAGQQSVSSLKQVLFIQAGLLVFLLFAQSAFAMPLSGLAWLANLIAIPWVSFVVLPLCLMSFVVSFMHDGLALFGFQMADAVLDFLLAFLAALADVDWQWRLPITLWLKAVVFGLALTLLFARFNRAFALSLFLLLFSLLGFDAKKVQDDQDSSKSQFWVLDAGQGLSLVVQNGASLWVYDTGPAFERFSNARAVLTPYLESQSFDPMLSGLIVSHGDMDHAGESEWFADYFSPRTIWIGEPKRTPLKQTSTGCALGQSWEWASNSSSLRVDVLWPRKGYQATSANNHSCVVRFTLNGTAFLVMGDLEGEGERAMLAWMAEHHMLAELKADVLIAGHHGAEAASSMTLLKHVKPEYVVFSAGYLNRFRHPSSGAQARVKRISAQALNTFDTGAIAFSVGANNEKGGLLEPKLSRQRATDYWVLE